MLRLFVALVPPAPVRQEIAKLLARQDGLPVGRWLRDEQLHLTLAFLGECRPEALPTIQAAVDDATTASRAFDIELAGLGAFPNLRRARVAFLRAGAGATELSLLAAELARGLRAVTQTESEKRFQAHLTLARFKQPPPEEGLRRLEQSFKLRGGWSFRARELTLMRSELHAAGARYSTLHRAPLPEGGRPE